MKSRKNVMGGRFVALLHSVLQSREYTNLDHAAKHMLTVIAASYTGHNNGKLVATPRHLVKFGWRSHASRTRCVDQLLKSGLLVETRIGMRPNRAAWYALSWRPLDYTSDMEIERGAFRVFHGTALFPLLGQGKRAIDPSSGKGSAPPIPASGTIRAEKTQFLSQPVGSI